MRLLATICLLGISIGSAYAAGISGQGTWESTLLARDLNNDSVIDAYYDTALDISWLADANYARTSGYDTDGLMNWSEANQWVDSLNDSGHLGVTDWMLPEATILPSSCDSAINCGGATGTSFDLDPLSHLYYVTLGNSAYSPGAPAPNTGDFLNVSVAYWVGPFDTCPPTEISPIYQSCTWFFQWTIGDSTSFGQRWTANPIGGFSAWAIRDGDIGASIVPIPAAVWLFGSALFGLGWFRKVSN